MKWKKPAKTNNFVWEPIEGFKLEPKFLTPSNLKKLKFKRGTKSVEIGGKFSTQNITLSSVRSRNSSRTSIKKNCIFRARNPYFHYYRK
jgi:hypothetical protein